MGKGTKSHLKQAPENSLVSSFVTITVPKTLIHEGTYIPSLNSWLFWVCLSFACPPLVSGFIPPPATACFCLDLFDFLTRYSRQASFKPYLPCLHLNMWTLTWNWKEIRQSLPLSRSSRPGTFNHTMGQTHILSERETAWPGCP